MQGHEGELFAYENSIVENEGDGLICLVGCKPIIQKNEIFQNQNGIVLNSCDARILQNFIYSNLKNGIYLMTAGELLNNSCIKMNHVSNNKGNGILVEGMNCWAIIQSNYHISENGECGIKLSESSYANIVNNFIYYNNFHGILIQEKSFAKIHMNSVFKNLKSNIALGGEGSGDTMILQNSIHSSPSEGILMIQCANTMVYKNEIFNNYDGIVIYESCPEIRMNHIRNNTTNGILILKSSAPIVEGNVIEENELIGVVIKDISEPLMIRNRIENNEVNVASENISYNYQINKEEYKGRNIFLNRDVCSIF